MVGVNDVAISTPEAPFGGTVSKEKIVARRQVPKIMDFMPAPSPPPTSPNIISLGKIQDNFVRC